MRNITSLILLFVIILKVDGQTSSTSQKDISEKFKVAIVGTWYSEGQGGADREIGAIFDTVLYNNLPFKSHDKIVFYENGFFKVNDSETLKRYEIVTDTVQSFDFNEGEHWIFQIRLDGFEYFAIFRFFNDGTLSLGYNYGTGSWSQPLRKK